MTDALPIEKLHGNFDAALARGHLVVSAATGSGKSTRLPLWARQRGPVLVVEPRRVACTALADYVAGLADSRPGEAVGYAIRFEQQYRDDSEIVFATPGIALRWLSDGTARRFHTVMLDEFHERRWDTDLLLALLKAGGEHRLLLTSATLAARRLADYLDAPLLESAGRNFPVEVDYSETGSRDMPSARGLDSRVARAVKQMLEETDGDLLVFLPGKGEIQAARNALQGVNAELISLHASVARAEQQRALRPGDRQRVILATNVAETSLTIPGVTRVIDSGLERRTHQRNGRTVLTLAPVSRAGAEQRRGRAGRTGPGRCLRLWGDQAPLEEFMPPEIQREPLTEMMLAAAAAGQCLESLDFPDPLPEKSLEQAREQLLAMKAIDPRGRITDHGRALFVLPIDTLFAHLITAMPDAATRGAMVDLSAALSTRPPILRLPAGERERRELTDWQPQACDATTLIQGLRREPPQSLRHDSRARREARRLASQIRRRLELPALSGAPDFQRDALLRAALEAVPELAFVRREKRRHALGNGFREVTLADDSRMPEDAEAALVLDEHSVPGKRGTRQTFTVATCLAPVPLSMLVAAGLGESRPGPVRLEEGRPVLVEERYYANRVIERRETVPAGEALRAALARLILEGRLLTPAGEHLREDLRQWHLYVALGQGEGETPEPQPWLQRRLTELGVENAEDLELIEPEDLAFPGIPDWERQRFDDRYPARLNIDTMRLQVHYDVDRKRITVERTGGDRKTQPQRWELPAWPGWRIRFRDGSKVVDIK